MQQGFKNSPEYFIQKIEAALQKILSKEEVILNDPENLIYLESQKFVFKIKKLIFQLRQEKNTHQIKLENLIKHLVKLLQSRFEEICDTNGYYSHNTQTFANQISLKIAEIIGDYKGIHPILLLAPSILPAQFSYPDHINKFILSDDNKKLINVVSYFKQPLTEQNQLPMTYRYGEETYYLTENEKQRLINFNADTVRYSKQIEINGGRGCEKALNQIQKNMGYKKESVTYGDDPSPRLKVLHYPKDLSEFSRQKFISQLLKYPTYCWGVYLKNISAPQLKKLLCGDKPIKAVVGDESIYTGNVHFDSAFIYALLTLYRKELHLRPGNFLGWGGSITGYSKMVKDNASKILTQFIENGGQFKDYDAWFAQDQFVNVRPALTNGWDTLSAFHKQIKLLGTEKYNRELRSKGLWQSIYDMVTAPRWGRRA